MPIRKDKKSGIWHLDICPPSGARIRRSTETRDRKAAQEYHDRLKAELWRQDKLGEKADRTFEEAAVRFLQQCVGQRDYAGKLRHVLYWREQFGATPVRLLTAERIFDALPTHKRVNGKPARPLSPGTRNRYINTIRRLLNLCVEWEWLDRTPKLRRFEEPDVRVRWETPEVIITMINALRLPWMRDAAIVAVATGMRESELFGLTVSQIDLAQRNAWITHAEAKSKRARSVPLNEDAISVLERRMRTATDLVFTREYTRGDGPPKLIRQIDKRDFARACRAAGMIDFHWHDLRHTWASWHVQRGTPLMVLKELGGWETIAMVQKYAHLAPSHLAQHADTVKFLSMSAEEAIETPQSKAA
ncbi:tyrosine-type recombinase/integrase [Burkholderia pseudomallei]|uniref:tyrosine-type recombinase/integrase n=1 Tax=Burkholderia pseudomallei TaxID=28450 RepID=UPI0005391883|nr:site-specific integrase [Burkholderia pseudomallei]AJX78379.1 phage integrase family protein [Burkholderia pseudomallei MSHR2543]KGW22152.1 phage integrase family protein [Burkholderia pseudomallei MSHR733]OMY93294.1 integrase [Burkholderia pseudomallei]OMY98325.1 integrase [Burkholderia pseudomallei]OMZ14234.1 integrase [Burkholderia pseudomallei]